VLKLLKRTLRDGSEMPLTAALAHEQAIISLVFDPADAHEGNVGLPREETSQVHRALSDG